MKTRRSRPVMKQEKIKLENEATKENNEPIRVKIERE